MPAMPSNRGSLSTGDACRERNALRGMEGTGATVAEGTANDETRAGGGTARGTKVRPEARRDPAPSLSPPEPHAVSRAELRRRHRCRGFAHQFAAIARRIMAAAITEDRKRRESRAAWTAHRLTPPPAPGLAAVKHEQQRGEREAGLRRGFRTAGQSTRAELFEHFRRTVQLAVCFALFPQP